MLARSIVVRKDMKVQPSKRFDILFLQERCARNGYCLVTGREHCPTVATAFRHIEWFARFEHVQYLQAIDMTLAAFRETKARFVVQWRPGMLAKVTPLDALQSAIGTQIRDEQMRLRAADATPPNDTRVELSLVEQEMPGLLGQYRLRHH